MEDSITGNIKIGKNIHTELLRLSDDAEKKTTETSNRCQREIH